MADNVFTKYGGKVKYTPERVQSNDADVEYSDADQIRNIALQRDLTAANLLENDILLDALDAAIDDQMKEFALTVPELYDAASNLCGGPTVTWECYKKAKELLKIAPWIAYGYDPTQLTFTDKFVKRAGNVVFNCKEFNADTFQNTGFDPMKEVDDALNGGPNTETPSEIEKKARENQKKWSLLMLFWDLLWGKPVVKPSIPDEEARKQNIDLINAEIAQLKANSQDTSLDPKTGKEKFTEEQRKGKGVEADNLAKRLAQSENLPNTIMLDRPRHPNQLQWTGKSGGPIEYNLNPVGPASKQVQQDSLWKDPVSPGNAWVDDAQAVWVDYGSLLGGGDGHGNHKDEDFYKDRSIPALKSGFILSILIGFISLVPKVVFYFVIGRVEFLKSIKWMKTKKFPVVGRVFLLPYKALKFIISIITAVAVVISNIFLEICIWLAMMPQIYLPNVSDLAPLPQTPHTLKDMMEVEETPAGFVSMDCFVAAQEIVNRVNQEAVN